MRLGVFALAGTALLAACGSPASPAVTYQSYTYNCCAEIAARMLTWHAGQRVTLHWQSQAGPPTTDNTPHMLSLKVTLTGPFQTVDALKQSVSQGRMPAGVRLIDAKSPAVSDRTPGVAASELDLPADLPPGYYEVDTTVAGSGGSASGGAIVTIQ